MRIIKLHILLLLITVLTSVGALASGNSGETSAPGDALTSVADYDTMYLLGSATPAGWSIGNPTPMEMDENDPLVFHWTGNLSGSVENPGEIKFPTYKGADAWCDGDWLHPVSEGQALSNSEAVVLTGCAENNPDYKWNVTKDTTYAITVNLNDTTVTFTEAAPVEEETEYENLYLVGDATPGGWDLANQTAMTADPDEYVFSWTGTLSAGGFKIKTYAAEDFCAGEWIHPLVQDQPFSETGFEFLQGCVEGNTDYTWMITEEDTGTYSINVNLSDTTITIEKEASTSIEDDQMVESFTLSQNYPNPFNPTTRIEYALDKTQKVELSIYNVTGQKISTLINSAMPSGAHTVNFDGSGLSSGIYYYRLTAGEQSITRRMTLIK